MSHFSGEASCACMEAKVFMETLLSTQFCCEHEIVLQIKFSTANTQISQK
jgi:hypothetical protein